jgi:hypothetical protein
MVDKKSARIAVEMEFADGVTRTVKPLTIKQLRQFVKISDKLLVGEREKLTDKDIDLMMDAAAIVMKGIDTKLAENRDALEDAIDVEIFWKLFSVAMGNRLEENPNA